MSPLLEEWGVSAKATRLIAAWHSGPGFAMAIALRSLKHDKAADKGASWGTQSSTSSMRKHLCVCRADSLIRDAWQEWCPNRPFDPDTGSAVTNIDIVDVGDVTVLIVAASPASLRRALDALLTSLIELFTLLSLVINWNPGKTKIMLMFRATGSVAKYERLQSDHGSEFRSKEQICVPTLFTLTTTWVESCRVTIPT